MRRFLPLLLILFMLWPASGFGENCHVILMDDTKAVETSDSSVLRVQKTLMDAAEVRIQINREDTGDLILSKSFGIQWGCFDSGELYLPQKTDEDLTVAVTLLAGQKSYKRTYTISRNLERQACTVGPRLTELGQSGDWMMATLIDLDALRETGSQMIDLCVQDKALLGKVNVILSENRLRVEPVLPKDWEPDITSADVYLWTDFRSLTWQSITSVQPHALGEWIDVGDMSAALLYLPMTMRCDLIHCQPFAYSDIPSLKGQRKLWKASTVNMDQPRDIQLDDEPDPPSIRTKRKKTDPEQEEEPVPDVEIEETLIADEAEPDENTEDMAAEAENRKMTMAFLSMAKPESVEEDLSEVTEAPPETFALSAVGPENAPADTDGEEEIPEEPEVIPEVQLLPADDEDWEFDEFWN